MNDYVQHGGKVSDEFGVKGYHISTKSAVDPRLLHGKIFPTKKRTYIDYAVDDKRHVPNKYYNIGGNILQEKGKSNLEKSKRRTIMDEVIAMQRVSPCPAPNAYKANFAVVQKKVESCLKQSSPQRALLDEPLYRGETSPQYYTSQYSQVDKKITIPVYGKKVKPDYDVATFLKTTLPTKKVSPCTYNALDSFKTTVKSPKRFNFKARPTTEFEMIRRRSQKTPGVGQYPIDAIEKGLSLTTKGFSRGWK